MTSDIWSCAGRELSRRKARTATNCLGYVLSVGILVAMLHLLLFSHAAEEEILRRTGVYFMAFSPVISGGSSETIDLSNSVSPDNEAFVANSVITKLIPKHLVKEIRAIPTVKNAAAFLVYRLRDPRDGHFFNLGGFEVGDESAVGTTCCAKTDIVKGAFISNDYQNFLIASCCTDGICNPLMKANREAVSKGETPDSHGVVMVEEGYASVFEIKVGDLVEIAGMKFPVVGIVNPGIRPAKADIYMTFNDARFVISRVLNKSIDDETNLILVEVNDSEAQQQAMDEAKKVVQGGVISTYKCFKPAAKVLGMSQVAMWVLTLVMIAGTVLISFKSQMTSVIERRRDIGILKAIGWTDQNVVGQLMAESVMLSFTGGFLGCFLGSVVFHFAPIKIMSGLDTRIEPVLHPSVLFAGVVIALFCGALGGIVPAWFAARESPVEAMKRV